MTWQNSIEWGWVGGYRAATLIEWLNGVGWAVAGMRHLSNDWVGGPGGYIGLQHLSNDLVGLGGRLQGATLIEWLSGVGGRLQGATLIEWLSGGGWRLQGIFAIQREAGQRTDPLRTNLLLTDRLQTDKSNSCTAKRNLYNYTRLWIDLIF